MSDVNANIGVHIDTSSALAELKALQKQLALFHGSISQGSAAAASAQAGLQKNLLNSINATGKFTASMGVVRTATESFTHDLEKNKLSMGQYFRFAGGSTRTFGKLFKSEFDTIGRVAEERVRKMQTQYIKMGRDASGAMKAIAVTPNTLNIKDYGVQTAIAAQKQALFNQLVKQGSTQLLNFGKNTQWAGRQLMVGFTVPLMYLGTAASKVFMDLEKQTLKFKRVYGDMFTSPEQTNQAVEGIQLLAKEYTKYGVAVAKTMEMAATAAAQGKVGADLTAQVSNATRLAVLGSVEQEQALETTISLTNAFGLAAEDLAQKIDFLNAVENQTVLSIEDLTIAIPKAGPVVKQLGGDVEDLAFFMTAMKEGGINASEGANALKSGLASMINPAKKTSEFLASLGINIKSIVDSNAGNVKATVIALANALDTLDPLNRARAIEQLFGKFQFSRLSTLFQNVTKDGTQAARTLQLAGASIEELAILSERELKTVEDSVGVSFQASVEKLKLSIAPIGKEFLKAVTPIVQFVGDLLEKFNGLGDGTKKFIVIATTLVGVIGPVLIMTFGLLANGAANIIKLFLAMRQGFMRLGGGSNLLAEQTNYLNSEQLEAATVAASLNQVHSKLTQQFVLETSAVKALRNAYVQATIAGAKFASTNPGMMVPGARGRAPGKYAKGATYVPGRGNKDNVPAVLTPGEAVIPAGVAQDPKFQPIIDAMVSGRLQAFNGGEKNVQPTKKAQDTHVGSGVKVEIDELLDNPNLTEADQQRLKIFKGLLKTEKSALEADIYHALKFKFDGSLNRRMAKAGISYSEFEREWENQGYSKWRDAGIFEMDAVAFDDELKAKVKSLSNGGVVTDTLVEKAFKELSPEMQTTSAYKKALEMYSATSEYGVKKGLPTTLSGLEDMFKRAMAEENILNLGPEGLFILDGDELGDDGKPKSKNAKKYLPKDKHTIVTRTDSDGNKVVSSVWAIPQKGKPHLSLNRIGDGGKRFPVKFEKERSSKEQKIINEANDNFKKSSIKKEAATDLGTKIGNNPGRSFDVQGVGGFYEKPDGTRVFVKPVLNETAAQAEIRATQIAREAHGLKTPIQKMIVMEDPKTNKKIIALESPMDEKFTPKRMTGKFSKEDYFKQTVAAALRGDADLAPGNMSGDRLTDVGPAGVFSSASGNTEYAKSMRSMEEQATIFLQEGASYDKDGVVIPRKTAFRKSTLDLIKDMTPAEYKKAMVAEIDRVLPKLIQTVNTLPNLTDDERTVYNNMINRLRAGRNADWEKIHGLHTGNLQFVTKDEVFEDKKTKKQTNIPREKTPSGSKPSSGKLADNKTTTVPSDKNVVKKRRPRKAGKFLLPSNADAPYASPYEGLSTDEAAIQKSLRRQAIKLEKDKNIALKKEVEAAKDPVNKSIRRQREKLEKDRIYALKQEEKIQRDLLRVKQESVKSEQKRTFDQNKKAATQQARMQRMQGIGMAAGMASTAGYMTGNTGLGNALMGVSVAAMLGEYLKKPMGILAVSALGVAAMLYKFNKDINDARKSGVEYAKALSMGKDKLIALSKVTGTVSASEEADKRTENILTGQNAVQRKFGQNVLGSEFGKQLLSDIEKQAKSGQSISQIGETLSNNLAYAVVQGVVTPEQARSIAGALGEELKSYEIPAIVSGNLVKLLGPNGERLEKDPLSITLEIQKQSMKKQAAVFQDAINSRKNPVTAGGLAALAVGSAGVVGAGLGMLASTGVGAPVAAIASVALISKALYDQNKIKAENAKLDAAATQIGIESVVMNNGLVDSLNRQFDVQLKSAQSEKEIKTIEENRAKALDELNSKNSDALDLLIAQKDQLSDGAFNTGIKSAVDNLYKDGPMKEFAGQALKQLAEGGDSTFKTMLQVELASGGLDPLTVLRLLENPELESKYNVMVEAKGSKETNLIIQLLMKTGADEQNFPVFMDIINKDPKNFEKNMAALEVLANMRQKYGVTINVNDDGTKQLTQISDVMTKLSGMPDELTQEAFFNLGLTGDLSETEKDIIWKTLVGTSKTINQEVIFDFVAAGDINVIDKYLADKGLSVPQFLSPETQRAAKQSYSAEAQAELVGRQGREERARAEAARRAALNQNASRDTTLDDLLKKLKLTRDASINAEGGIEQLRKTFKKASGDIKQFNGVNQQLRKLYGADSGFVDFVGGMSNAVAQGYLTIKNGVVALSKDGKLALKGYKEAQLGAFGDAANEAILQAKNQRDGFVALKAAGVSSADALEMISDGNFAVSLSAAKTTEIVKGLVAQFKAQRAEAEKTLMATDPLQYFSNQRSVMDQKFDVDERNIRAQYEPAIEAVQKEIDGQNEIIRLKQYELETNKLINTARIDSINKEIDLMQRNLAIGVNTQLDGLSRESAKYSEDLTIIGKITEDINKKYDLQEEALSKISEINQDIIDQEKSRITLADALSSGDISAAAQAAQAMREQSAEVSARRMSEGLAAAREAEIAGVRSPSGMTADQIAKRQYEIERLSYSLNLQRQQIEDAIAKKQEEIYQINVKRETVTTDIKNAEAEIYKLVNQTNTGLIPLQNNLNLALDSVANQRKQWDAAERAIATATVNTQEFKDKIFAAEALVKSINELWAGITDKTLTVTLEKIEKVISGGASGGASDQSGAPTNKTTLQQQAEESRSPLLIAIANAAAAAAKVAETKKEETKKPTNTVTDPAVRRLLGLASGGMVPKYMAVGGVVLPPAEPAPQQLSKGGLVKYFAKGGFSRGTDTVPAMLSPGEFIVNAKSAQSARPLLTQINSPSFKGFEKINLGTSKAPAQNNASVYNYTVGINVNQSNSSPDDIAKAVMGQIKYMDSQRIRGQR
jgi:TP901 family phage tail tape measure protein